jgi:hypothetical protein
MCSKRECCELTVTDDDDAFAPTSTVRPKIRARASLTDERRIKPCLIHQIHQILGRRAVERRKATGIRRSPGVSACAADSVSLPSVHTPLTGYASHSSGGMNFRGQLYPLAVSTIVKKPIPGGRQSSPVHEEALWSCRQ